MDAMPDPHRLVNEAVRSDPHTTHRQKPNSGDDAHRSPPQRARGRPRKPAPIDRRCKEPFAAVAAAVADIPPELWPAVRERVSRWADRDKSLRPISGKVLRLYLECLNRAKGYDWHSAETIAEDLGVHVSALEKAHHELTVGGFVLRERVAVKGRRRGAAWMWRTTIPALVRAAAEVATKRAKKAEEPAQEVPKSPPKKDEEPTQEIPKSPPKKDEEPTQEIPKSPPKKDEEPTQKRGVESVKESVKGISPPLTPPSRRKRRDRGARARDGSAAGSDVDQLLAPLCAKPEWRLAVEHLLEPIVRQRRILAPDPAHLVRRTARWAAGLPVETLKAAAYRVLEERHSTVTEEAIVAAVRGVQADAGLPQTLDRPAAPAAKADGMVLITESADPTAFAAWVQYLQPRADGSQSDGRGVRHLLRVADEHRALRVPSRYPPAPPTGTSPVPADATIH